MKHSNLNTAEQLHFAKVRTFTGASSAVTPDFIDQLLVNTETKEQFIATGTNAGQLVKLLGDVGNSPPPSPTAIDTAAFLSKILVQNGEILTTDNDQIIFQE